MKVAVLSKVLFLMLVLVSCQTEADKAAVKQAETTQTSVQTEEVQAEATPSSEELKEVSEEQDSAVIESMGQNCTDENGQKVDCE